MSMNIVEIAVANNEFSTLVAALKKANLVDALTGQGPFTVFAPTDEAFGSLLAELKIDANDLLNHPKLSDILLYHVVGAKVMSSDITDGMEATTLNGEKVMLSIKDGVFANKSKVIKADIDASNGVIHVIDAVLMPKNI